jgi:hypothetical protein
MFDPTIYDNLKVVLEGAIYDLDLAGTLNIKNRSDLVDLSVMSRSFRIDCRLKDGGPVQGSVLLTAGLADLAAELLNASSNLGKPGCGFQLQFRAAVSEPAPAVSRMKQVLATVWEGRPEASFTICYDPDREPVQYTLTAVLEFGRKLDEEQAEDLPRLVDHFVLTLQELSQLEELGAV